MRTIPREFFVLIAVFIVVIFGFIHHGSVGPLTHRLLYPLLSPAFNVLQGRGTPNTTEEAGLLEIRRKARLYDELSQQVVRGASLPEIGIKSQVNIVARPHSSPYGTVIIGAGSEDDVEEADLVLFPDHVAYGTVDTVHPNSSIIVPFSRAGEQTDALLHNRIPIQVTGRGHGNFEFRLPKNISVAIGDLIMLSSGILLAEVGYVSDREESSFIEVMARSPVSISSYRFLELSDEPYE